MGSGLQSRLCPIINFAIATAILRGVNSAAIGESLCNYDCYVVVVVDPGVPAKVPIHPAPPLIWGRDGWAPLSGSRDSVVAICTGVNSRDISTASRRRRIQIICGQFVEKMCIIYYN
jgi:hypothetical protein